MKPLSDSPASQFPTKELGRSIVGGRAVRIPETASSIDMLLFRDRLSIQGSGGSWE